MSRGPAHGSIGTMLWSDLREERGEKPNEDARAAATMLRRCWWITAASAVLAFLLIR